MNKFCPKCKNTKNTVEFYKNHRNPDGMAYTCKACMAEYSKKHKNLNKDKVAHSKQKWYSQNKEYVLDYQQKFYKENKEKIIKRVVKYSVERRRKDPVFRLSRNIRSRVYKALKQKTSVSISSLVGCSLDDLKQHIESKWQPGMTWDNYGKWHVDHIKPLVDFNLLNEEELKKAAHFSNLQPLWAIENLKKNRY